MDKNTYLGIDPGQSGGFAVIEGKEIYCIEMPKTERDIWAQIGDFKSFGFHNYSVIELIHAFPGMSAQGTFTFARHYGFLRGCLTAAEIPFEEVRPQTWMKTFSMVRKKTESKAVWKKRLLQKAQQLFPKVEVSLATADALLIAEYCRRLHTGGLR